MANTQRGLTGRILIKGTIHCATGLHIGGGKDNMAIGVVDLTIVRDPLTRRPIIPGSSLKGKMRTLLAKALTSDIFLPKHKDDDHRVKRLFGSSSDKPIIPSRLQFTDAILTDKSVNELDKTDTDLYLSEIKYENTIDRLTSIATPRQIERVPAGSEFGFKLTYLIESGIDHNEIMEDLKLLEEGMSMLQQDYLGGHGSRGSGRIVFRNIQAECCAYLDNSLPVTADEVQGMFGQLENKSFYKLVGV